MNRLLLIGMRTEENPAPYNLDRVFNKIEHRPVPGQRTRAVRVSSPTQVVELVAKARLDFFDGERVDILEMYDHAALHYQLLGDGPVFALKKDGTLHGAELAAALGKHLAPTAHLRLLGCHVAGSNNNTEDAKIRRMLVLLAHTLGESRVAAGTVSPVVEEFFDNRGLLPYVTHRMLFTSLAAVDTTPPEETNRASMLADVEAGDYEEP